MSDNKLGSGGRRSGQALGRKSKNNHITKSGKVLKVNYSLTDKIKARRDRFARKRSERLAGMPKSRVKRIVYRLHPKRLYKYWFSREGGIMALKIAGIGIIASFLLLLGVFAYFRKDLPNLKDISGNNIGGSIRYYDKTGQTLLFEDYDAVKRIPMKDSEISQYVKDATVAAEDKGFFRHGGFDVRGIARAGFSNALGHGGTQGGSTITQQLVRLTQSGVGHQQTYQRKIKELILSIELERSYSKQEILTGYLNTAPYGNVQYGVEASARDYFQKSAKDLTLDEATFLAAIPKAPSYYSPYGPYYDKSALASRQHYILDLMEQQHMISVKQRDDAKKIDTIATVKNPVPKYDGIKAPYFVKAAKDQMEKKFTAETVKRGGWRVTTTLDLNLQNIAEDEIQKGIAQVKRQGGDTAAFVAEDVKTGQVVALVGNAVFDPTDKTPGSAKSVNFAHDAKLPPGSSFKPYDYTALIQNNANVGAGSVLNDSMGKLDDENYPCTNKNSPKTDKKANCLYDYDFKFPGPLTLRYALGGSRNVPAVKAMLITGVDKTIETADQLMSPDGDVTKNKDGYQCFAPGDESLTKTVPCGGSSAIGDGAYLRVDEHVHGYASISRNGLNIPQTYILKIEDATGKTVDQWKQEKGTQVVRPDAAYIVADMMSDPNASYFPASRKPHRYKGWKFAMKTGTTNDSKDGWMMGFSTQYAAGVWVGQHNNSPRCGGEIRFCGTMEDMTQPIWQHWMNRSHDNIKPEDRAVPAGLQTLPAFVVRSHVGIGSVEPSPATDLFPSWYQAKKGTTQRQTIDVISNKLATDCTPARARKDVTNADTSGFSIDKYVGQGAAARTNQTDDVHVCGEAQPSVQIASAPSSCTGSCTINVTVEQGAHPLSSDQHAGTLNVLIGGQVVQAFQVNSPGAVPLTFDYSGSGSQAVTVQIIDSVLYDSTSSPSNIDFTAAPTPAPTGSAPLTLSQPAITGNSAKFTWSGGGGVFTVHVTKGAFNTVCNAPSGNTCSVILGPHGNNYQAYVTDTNGDPQSETITFNYP